MSGEDFRGQFLYKLPPYVLWKFYMVMDGLSDLDWTRFASEILSDQDTMRLAERRQRRTEWVMARWEARNGRVGELLDLLERLQLLYPRDLILNCASSVKSSFPPPPAPPAAPAARPPPPVSLSQFDPPPKSLVALPTCQLSTTDKGGGRPLPGPSPPPPGLQSELQQGPKTSQMAAEAACDGGDSGAMCWLYEEVHAGTEGFSPARKVGEGGFGVVYRATLKNTDCAVKRLKQDCSLDWTLLKKSFQTEVEKLSKFRHPNIVDLLGYSKGHGSVCLIYSYMENRSLEDQLHNECDALSWSQRISIVKGASTALQFLHSPPDGHNPVIHGDVKSSNILLDRYMVAKLGDFGLARFASHSSSDRSTSRTKSIGKTETVRGTLAYLPDEYVRSGELGTVVDVYSFGVVLLEVLTGRRALERDRKSGDMYLKDLVKQVEDSPTGSYAAAWRKQLDHRLTSGDTAEPAGCMEMVALACRCLDKKKKKRPTMTEVFDKLKDIHNMVKKKTSSSSLPLPNLQPPSQSFPTPPRSLDSCVEALSYQLSKVGPLEDTYQLTPPCPLYSSSSSASSLPTTSSSFVGPCETDESRGFSQYDLGSQSSQFSSNGTGFSSLSLSTRGQHHSSAGPSESRVSQPSVPTEDQYNFPPQPSNTSNRTRTGALIGAPSGSQQDIAPEPNSRRPTTEGLYGNPECPSPVRSLHSSSPGPSVIINPSKQQFLEKKTLYEAGRIQTPELLSSDDLYGGRSSVDFRGPEESDELDYLPATHD
ncbi:hypothetical protein PAMA_021178 [Pampus argenteus]